MSLPRLDAEAVARQWLGLVQSGRVRGLDRVGVLRSLGLVQLTHDLCLLDLNDCSLSESSSGDKPVFLVKAGWWSDYFHAGSLNLHLCSGQ